MDLRGYLSVSDRRKGVEDNIGVSLKNIGNYSINEEIASSRNCENMIGVTQIPIGIAGPLKIKSEFFKEEFFFPYDELRVSQEDFINRVNECAEKRKHVLIHAPTGIGKTVSVLSPLLHYASKNDITIFFLAVTIL